MLLSQLYNGLGDVYDVSQEVEAHPEAIDSLASLLVANQLNGQYDIRLVHKHFDIGEHEQVVAFDGDGCKVSAVCTDGNVPSEVLNQHGVETRANTGFAPSDFFISEYNEAIPYQFAYGAASPPAAPLGQAFLKEWNSILNQHGLTGLLGLALQEGMPLGGHETSNMETRVSKLSFADDMPSSDSHGFATTSWRIANPGEGPIRVMKCTYCTVTTSRHNCSG